MRTDAHKVEKHVKREKSVKNKEQKCSGYNTRKGIKKTEVDGAGQTNIFLSGLLQFTAA